MNSDYEYLEPNAAALTQSLRAFGYDITTAVADLIDNSITAGAKNVNTRFEWNNGEPWVAITDDGRGMSEAELKEAMRLGSKSPLEIRNDSDLGRFGLGLKTASFSQCKRLTVVSKTDNMETPCMRCWDLDIVNESNQWKLLNSGTEIAANISREFFSDSPSGTIVLWEKLDKLMPEEYIEDSDYQDAFLEYIRAVEKHITCVFSDFMVGHNKIKFHVNGRQLKAWDPFMSKNDYTYESAVESFDDSNVNVQIYILPHQSKLTTDEFRENGGRKGWFEQQGFYIYRNNRLLVDGDWLFSDIEKKEQYKLARIRIDINNSCDNDWKIDVKKSIAVPPVSLENELRRLAKIAQKESTKIYRHRGKTISRKAVKNKTFVWSQNLRSGKIGYTINKEHPLIKELLDSEMKKEFSRVLELIEETVPVPLIISEYSEHPNEMRNPFENKDISEEYQNKLDKLYKLYLSLDYSPEDALAEIAGIEPFIYIPEVVQIFAEKKGLCYGK